MSLPPEAAICIPTFNQAPFLRAAVLSALAQENVPVEVWVGDDASTDDTPAVMAELCRAHPNLHYRRAEQNRGIAENSSWILAQPATPFVARLDSDDLLHPRYLSTLLTHLHAHAQAGYAHTAVVNMDAQGTALATKRVARPTGFQNADTALRAAVHGYRTAANILLFRAAALRALEYYHGRPEFVEDYDLAVRMAAAGWGNVYVDEPLASYRVWRDAGHTRARRKHLQLRGYCRIFEESLAPAFAARGWSLRPVTRGRRRFALTNVAYCHQALFSPAEQQELRALLWRLGAGWSLRVALLLAHWRLHWVLAGWHQVNWWARGIVKSLLSSFRRAPAVRVLP